MVDHSADYSAVLMAGHSVVRLADRMVVLRVDLRAVPWVDRLVHQKAALLVVQ